MYSIGDFIFYTLQAGDVLSLTLSKSEPVYILYHHYMPTQFKLMASKVDGSFAYGIMQHNISTPLTNFPSFDSPEMIRTSINSPHPEFLRMDTSDPLFCSQCAYLILIQPISTTTLTFIISVQGFYINIPNNKMIRDSLS